MAASFPNAKKTFSQVVNGVTKLVAALWNVDYDEVEAMQTFIGPTGGGSQSYSESIKNLLLTYRRKCLVEYKSVSDIYVRSGEVMIPDASSNVRLRRNPSDTTVTWAMIDTGAEANSTTYYIYAVADAAATTFTVMISASATTPTGATFYRRLGSFYNDASGNITLITNDDNLYQQLTTVDSAALAASQVQTLAHGLGIQPNRVTASLVCTATDNGYAVNDEIFITANYFESTTTRFWTIAADATNITTITGATGIGSQNKSTGAAINLTLSKWIFRIRCGV